MKVYEEKDFVTVTDRSGEEVQVPKAWAGTSLGEGFVFPGRRKPADSKSDA